MSKYRIFPIGEPDIGTVSRTREPPCEYLLLDDQRSNIVPSLADIIGDKSVGPFNRGNFIQYLSNSHCLENYEFIVFMSKFLEESREEVKKNAWKYILMTFLLEDAVKEINLPCGVRNGLVECDGDYPAEDMALKAKMIIYDLLCDSYNDFVKVMKLQLHSDCQHKTALYDELANAALHHHDFRPKGHSFAFEQFSPLSTGNTVELDNDDDINNDKNDMVPREAGSRGSSIGSLVDSLKNNDLVNWRKTVKKFRFRRFLNEI